MDDQAKANLESMRLERNRRILALSRAGTSVTDIARMVGMKRKEVHVVLDGAATRRLSWQHHPDPPIADLPLGKNVRTALTKSGIKRLSEIMRMPPDQIQRLPNLGPQTVKAITAFLDSFGKDAGKDAR